MTVNGEQVILEKEMTLKEFVEANGYDKSRIAVEKNGEIVPKSMYEYSILNENDTLEIVHFVGGG